MRRTALASCFVLLLATPASAQWQRRTSGVDAPLTIAGYSGAYALEINPAALAMVRGWEADLAYAGGDGHGIGAYGVTALPFGLSLAGAIDWRIREGRDDGRVSIGASYSRSRRFAFGAALRYVDGAAGRAGALDVGVHFAPSARLGIGVVVHDLLGPLGLTRGALDVPATLVAAAQLRPFEDDDVYAEVAGALDTSGTVGLRGALGARIPRVGRVLLAVEADDIGARDTNVRVLGSLVLDWGELSAGGGVIGALRSGQDDDVAGLAWASMRNTDRVGLPRPGYIDDLEIRGGLGTRRLLALLARLDRDRFRRDVRGVFLRLRGTAIGHAAAQEIREAIRTLQAAGKTVVCHLAAPTGPELYACAAADETHLDPAGSVALIGTATTVLHYGEALSRIGVRTDFVRIGEYKGAVEVYGSGGSTPAVRIARRALLDDVFARLSQDLAADWGVAPSLVRARINAGPYAAGEALESGLVRSLADEYDMNDIFFESFGVRRRRGGEGTPTPETFGRAPRVAVLTLDGSVVDGDNVDYPIVEIHQTGARTFVQTLEAVRGDDSIEAVVLRIDSPGGSALAADQIWRAVRRLGERKPVIASLGPLATSAAYYIASAADTIYADPSTVTGSIGVLFGKVDFAPLAEELGVGIEQDRRGRHAGAESLFVPFSDEERELLREKIAIYYELFLERVAEGRGRSRDEVHRMAQGRIWSGDAAHGLGLVDRLGGFLSALADARRRGGLTDDAPFVVAPRRPGSLLEYFVGPSLAGAVGASPAQPAGTLALDIAAALSAGSETPMAILPSADAALP